MTRAFLSRRFLFPSFLILAGLLAAVEAGNVRAEGVTPVSGNVDEVARTLASYFVSVEMKVLHVDGDKIVLDAGARSGLVRGMIVSLYRPGAAFRHPVSGQELGKYEKDLGKVEIIEASDTLAKGVAVPPFGGEVRIGDFARLSLARIPIAVIGAGPATDRAVLQDLRFALDETGRLTVADPEKVEKASAEQSGSKLSTIEEIASAAPKLGAALGVDYLVLVEAESGGRGWSASLLSAPRGTRVAALGPILSSGEGTMIPTPMEADHVPPVIAKPEPSVTPRPLGNSNAQGKNERRATVLSLPYSGRFVRVADVDGDGRPEIVTSDGTRIRIYRLENNNLKLLWEEAPFRKDQEHLWLDVSDINGNGIPEIFVTSRVEGRLDSYIIEYQKGFSRIVEHLPLYLHVARVPEEGDRLLVQRASLGEAFSGGVYIYAWKGDRYIRKRRIALPKGQSIFGFAFPDAGPRRDVIAYSPEDRLVVQGADGKRLYRSPERYGGSMLSFERKNTTSPLGEASTRVEIKGRIETSKGELVVFRNVPLARVLKGLPAYKEGEIIGLSWDGSSLAERWSISHVDGFIADFAVADVEKKGDPQVVILALPAVAKTSVEWEDVKNLVRGHSELLIYGLSEGTL